MSAEPPSSQVDPFARHLSQLLQVADLAGRLQVRDDEARVASDLVRLARLACRASRASLFQIDNAEADADAPLWVVRIARDAAAGAANAAGSAGSAGLAASPEPVDASAPFQPSHVGPLLSAIHAGGSVALGPLDDEEPFYARHRSVEPAPARQAAFCPVLVDGRPAGVLEIARGHDEAFDEADLEALEAAARSVAAAVYGARRERTIQTMLTELLPELLDPARAPTSLPDRLAQWLSSRPMAPAERQAVALASTIAQFSARSPEALELVQTVLSAARKAFARDLGPAWSEVTGGR